MNRTIARAIADSLIRAGFWSDRWPTIPMLITAALLSVLAAIVLLDLRMEGDVYGLLGNDDPVVRKFEALAAATPGLEELLVVCEPGHLMSRDLVSKLTAIEGVTAQTQSFIRVGKSSVQSFALSVDPADWRETRPIISAVDRALDRAGARCDLTGTPAIVQEMQTRVNTDLAVALLIAAALVSLIFAYVYRIGFLALLMLVPVLLGICWGLAGYTLLRGELTLLAATVPTLLIGIGIDHCIHMIQSCRYAMAEDGIGKKQAVLRAWRRVFAPMTLAAITTSVTFFALTTARLRGLADLGWSGALVTLGVYAACVAVLPSVLMLSPSRWLTRDAPFDQPIRRLAPLLRAHGKYIAALLLVTGAASAFGIARLESLDDNRLLESGDLPSLAVQERIAAEHGLSSSPILLRFANPADSIELLAEVDRPEQIGALLSAPGVDGLLHVHPRENTFIRHHYRDTVAALARWIDDAGLGRWELSGAPVMNERINELVYRDVRVVLPVAIAAIFVVLALGTRSLLRPCLVLLPLSLALIWLVGSMGLAGIAASVVTAAITPLVLGIGVDGGVHLLAAWDRHAGNTVEVFAETGLAIVISVLTSVTAFAAFVFARSPSLVLFGSQAAYALIGCLVVTLVVLPFLFRVLLPSPASTQDHRRA